MFSRVQIFGKCSLYLSIVVLERSWERTIQKLDKTSWHRVVLGSPTIPRDAFITWSLSKMRCLQKSELWKGAVKLIHYVVCVALRISSEIICVLLVHVLTCVGWEFCWYVGSFCGISLGWYVELGFEVWEGEVLKSHCSKGSLECFHLLCLAGEEWKIAWEVIKANSNSFNQPKMDVQAKLLCCKSVVNVSSLISEWVWT